MRIAVRNIAVIGAVLVLGAAGYTVMYLLTYTVPMGHTSGFNQALYAFVLIIIGLAVPYWILKLVLHEAHKRDSSEKEITLKDIPKDKEELARKP